MSEGFADFSASLFLQSAYGDKSTKKFLKFWDDERKSIVEKNAEGFRAIDVGPLTMGYRLNNSKAGSNIARDLIYPKGAYVLHMIRMMMWDRQYRDQLFKETMQDFVKTYAGKSASTEDFKAVVEKHMTDQMKQFGNGNMDWFFNEYVYGTALPTYALETANFETDATGTVVLDLKVRQSGVTDSFRMLVPIYLELADGNIFFLGRGRIIGNSVLEQKIPLKGLKEKPRRALINYYDDILAN
jgi:aminopeptidase N